MNEESSPSPPSAIDTSRLEKLRDLQKATGRDLLTQVIDLYRTDTPQRLDRLRRALAGGDAGEAERLAHSIKGSSANLGAPVVVALAAEIEKDVAGGALEGVDEKLARLEAEIDRVCEALEGFRPG